MFFLLERFCKENNYEQGAIVCNFINRITDVGFA